EPVRGICELLGLDPLYVANEGKLLAVVAPESADRVLAAMHRRDEGRGARIIGENVRDPGHLVVLKTRVRGRRVVAMLPGDQRPRIWWRGGGSRAMAIVEREVLEGKEPAAPETQPEPSRERLPLGPIKTIHVYWLAGMSCDGCTISVAGATNPGIEGLLAGTVPAMPKVILHHPVLSVEAGAEFVKSFAEAWEGKLGAPYVVVFEGSVADERIAGRTGGYFSAMGVEAVEGVAQPQPVPTATWLRRLAPGAAAAIAIGTCSTWGGIPSAEGNPTGAMSLMDFLGKDYRSAFGLPVINIP